ncbi:MAG TPA: UTP--glucose-1-phosphate uridylyltransferase [Patescibacteria group bacterium]|jgi:UTP--glucose-1-phosphate uridylyltransferase|nr:UTP--glucose-1-phosphate uridylyltransferase [Patescibacteria group bacterium]
MAIKLPTKAIIAAAGVGTRFLPQTKAMPKEMLPIVDKPVIQIIVEQLVAAGVTDIIIVTGYTKRPVEDHFDRSEELENDLISRGKLKLAEQIKAVAEMANFIYVRQKGTPKGNARPILNAQHLLNDEPFFVLFADDFFRTSVPYPVQLLEAYKQTGHSVISLTKVAAADASRLGMVTIESEFDEKTFKLKGLVEKPGAENTPSLYASVGSFLLTPDILPFINQQETGVGDEIVLADSINKLAQTMPVYGRVIDGVWHDAGDKLHYLQAIVDHALVDKNLGADFRVYLQSRLDEI